MRNARGETVNVPTHTIIETIRRAKITHAIAVKNTTTGQPAGAALFSHAHLRIVLDPDEVQAVTDILTIAEMEAMFTNQDNPEENQ
ncbi:hypothetical protein [Pseudarthrobacter sp. SSS035]|uniref:hypothetical protein n=1 Tax=Pseudarthrobacter sp. SSS035 TaxID=2931399 RepID=UPI00200FE810|nr:hypothetical protein [Pseudarthrobacter sp. SSS035]